jgi:hypothetical protein
MKRHIYCLLLVLLFSNSLFAQTSNLILYSDNGEQFTLILNGIKQNQKPQTNVKVTGLNAPNYGMKVIFVSQSIPDLTQTIYLKPGFEFTYSIKKNTNGLYKIRFIGDVVIEDPMEETTYQQVIQNPVAPGVVQQTTTTTD